ncbi:unnamed protein product [Cylicocyclus nassatus]|uniref:Uncharacterized protein n=1 Tax=Cylicocyclus nassatus TaxID=53992 RepID=A0AA36GFB7_CYLNA|nr:unnamed protein product [Cylicocyclus nassatus]
MRIFNLTFLSLTILVILSAVDVGECSILEQIRRRPGVLSKLPKIPIDKYMCRLKPAGFSTFRHV